MKQSEITDVRPLDLAAARRRVAHIIEAERQSEFIPPEVWQMRFHPHCPRPRPDSVGTASEGP